MAPVCVIAVTIGLFVYPVDGMLGIVWGMGVIALAWISFMDDLYGVSPWSRLMCHLIVAGLVFATIRGDVPDVGELILAVLIITLFVNSCNFMDGINGLAAGQVALTLLGTGLILGSKVGNWSSSSILLTLGAGGAALGFLPHNFPRAKVFLGDVGSVPLGFMMATVPLWIVVHNNLRLMDLLPVALLHINFIMDVCITLFRRILGGQRLTQSHREHFYQKLVRGGKKHEWVVRIQGLMQLVVLGLAMGIARWDLAAQWTVAGIVIFLWGAFFLYAEWLFQGDKGSITMGRILSYLTNLSPRQRLCFLLPSYCVVFIVCTLVAYSLRFEFQVPQDNWENIQSIWIWIWCLKLGALFLVGQFSSNLSYFSLPDLNRMGLAMMCVTAGILAYWYAWEPIHSLSRSVIVLDGILSFLGLAVLRLSFRLFQQGTFKVGATERTQKSRVGIVGAGEVGAALVRELQMKNVLEPVVFLDDAKQKHGSQIHGIPVAGPAEILCEDEAPKLNEVIIAMPSAPGARVRDIVELLSNKRIPCRTVPSMNQIAMGEVITQLRPVEVGDILGRETVFLDPSQLHEFFRGKTVLITGAGGSIGSELCRQLVGLEVARLILVDHSEYQLFEIHAELSEAGVELIPEVLDVQDVAAIISALSRHQPSVIFHAAAYKHVSLMERQPMMAIRNNVLATHQLARAAAEQGVEHFILISTDKAVSPSSVMGASKLLAEQVLQGHARGDVPTCFVTVRFGNVLGSSGSVVPIFQKQIEAGGPVTVTDEKTTRFFMSIPEAAGLVLRSSAMGKNKARFILDMGRPVRIMDLAKEMIRLSGYKVGEEIEIQCIGLRPGEKLHEELHDIDEQLTNTAHPKIKHIQGGELTDEQWRTLEVALHHAMEMDDHEARKWLHKLLPEFQPQERD
jgi:FlaA1/EpsC-like NDP-sugar epimerase/UDP-N-acetylmuramyl pentapeptide phosphotransferase/UDP-N-acetylglucosamine-1-phosphate transferase